MARQDRLCDYCGSAHDYDASDTISCLRDQVRHANERATWHPIDTAPKDGTEILVCGPEWLRAGVAVWSEHDACWQEACNVEPHQYTTRPPTHWMPLPEPPEGKS